jgi:hypothetical protein
MKCTDLTKVQTKISQDYFEVLSQIDDLYISSPLQTKDQLSYLKSLSPSHVIEIKNSLELIKKNNITSDLHHYKLFEFSDYKNIDHEKLDEFKKIICQLDGIKFIYSSKPDNTFILLLLTLCFSCGHSKKNCLELARKFHFSDPETIAFLEEKLKNKKPEKLKKTCCF